MTEADESTLEEDVTVLTITDAEPEGENTETIGEIRYCLPWNDCAVTEKTGLTEVL